MHRITLELDDESYIQATRTAQLDGVTLEEWLTDRMRDLLAGHSHSPALFLPGDHRTSLSTDYEAPPGAPVVSSHSAVGVATSQSVTTRLVSSNDTVRCRIARISAEQLEQARREPFLLEVLLFPYQPGEAGASDDYPMATEIVDLAGSWDGLHYLLNQQRREHDVPMASDDLFSLALYGASFGNDMSDLGHGPPGYLPPQTVQTIAMGLTNLRETDLRVLYDPAAMDARHVYPLNWVRDRREGWDYLLYYFDVLRDFYIRAAIDGNAIVLCYW